MNRVLRRVLLALVVFCGFFVSGYLAVQVPRAGAASPPPPVDSEALLRGIMPPEAPSRPVAEGPAPRLVAEGGDHDFGAIPQGEAAEHVFALRNEGDGVAHLQGVKSSCGCTATVLSRDTVPPGGTAEVKATFQSRNFRGRFHKTIRVSSDDPASPLVLDIRGRVVPLVQVDPELVLFGALRPGQEVTRRVVLLPGRPGVTLAPVAETAPPLGGRRGSVRVTSARPLEGGAWALELTARPQNAGSSIPSSLLVPTGVPEAPYALIRMTGQVENP